MDFQSELGNGGGMYSSNVNRAGEAARLVCSGSIDAETSPDFDRDLTALREAGVREILVDLKEVEFLNSSGIGAIIKARRRIGEGGRVCVVNPSAFVRRVLEVSELFNMLYLEENSPVIDKYIDGIFQEEKRDRKTGG